MSVLQVEKKIKTRVKSQMERTQREYYLNEQMKAIQKELGDGEEGQNEVAELEERINGMKLSKEALEKANAEVKKLKTCHQCLPRRPWCAIIWIGCCPFRGAPNPA